MDHHGDLHQAGDEAGQGGGGGQGGGEQPHLPATLPLPPHRGAGGQESSLGGWGGGEEALVFPVFSPMLP